MESFTLPMVLSLITTVISGIFAVMVLRAGAVPSLKASSARTCARGASA